MQHPNILPMLGFANDDELFQPFGAFVSPVSTLGSLGRVVHDLTLPSGVNLVI